MYFVIIYRINTRLSRTNRTPQLSTNNRWLTNSSSNNATHLPNPITIHNNHNKSSSNNITTVNPVREWSRCARRLQSPNNRPLSSLRSQPPQALKVRHINIIHVSQCYHIFPRFVIRRHQHAWRSEVAATGVQTVRGGKCRTPQGRARPSFSPASRTKSEFLFITKLILALKPIYQTH